jgi:hypothetical protein
MANFYVITMANFFHGYAMANFCHGISMAKICLGKMKKIRDCNKNITIAPRTCHRISFRMFCDVFKK